MGLWHIYQIFETCLGQFIVSFCLFMEFIDNRENTEYHQTDHLMNNVILKRFYLLNVCLSFHRPHCTGEATVDLPLTKDTTFPRSSPLPLNFSERAPSVVVEVDCTQF